MTAYLIVYGKDPSDRFAAYTFSNRVAARLASVSNGGNLTPGVPPGFTAGGCSYVIERDEDIPFNPPLLVAVYNALTSGAIKKFESRAIGVKRLMCMLPKVAVPAPIAIIQEENTMSDDTTYPISDQPVEAAVAEKPKKEKPPRVLKIGEFKPVRATSALGKVIEAALAGGTLAEVAAMAETTEEDLSTSLKSLRRSHGIDHEIVDGLLTLKIPYDQSPFIAPKEPKPKVERVSNGAEKSPIVENGVITLLVDKNPKRPTAAAYARFEIYHNGQTVSEFLAAGGTKADLSWDRAHDFIKIDTEQAQAAE